jgi:hypothetical protein
MMEHLPGKTAKQIRDKRKDPSYKALMEGHTTGCSVIAELLEYIGSSSDSETEIRAVPTRRYVSKTGEEKNFRSGRGYQATKPLVSGTRREPSCTGDLDRH